MAVETKLEIINRGLQRIGAKRLVTLTENTKERLAVDAAYEAIVRQELMTNFWTFSIVRESITADVTGPIFGRSFSFAQPADYLRSAPRDPAEAALIKRCLFEQDRILSDDGGPLELRYVTDLSDLTMLVGTFTNKEELFHPLFANAVAMRLGMEVAEELVGSSAKLDRVESAYVKFVNDARRVDAIEAGPIEPEIDEFVAVRGPLTIDPTLRRFS